MSIVLCDPIITPHRKHLQHIMGWYAANKDRHNLVLHLEVGKPLQRVQGDAVEVARGCGASHVLFTEHDQWAYPVDALDVLLEYDREVIGMQTYQRGYPYLSMHMRKIDPSISFISEERNLRSFQCLNPIEETDLLTWGFTLVAVDVFDRMESAGLNPWIWDMVPTDSHFCQCCEDLKIPRYVCSEATIAHGDIPDDMRLFMRRATESYSTYMRQQPGEMDGDHAGQQVYETELGQALAGAADTSKKEHPPCVS